LYVGRDGRDVIWSWYNHHSSFTPQAYETFNSIPGRLGPPLEPPVGDVVQYFRRWMDGEEMSLSDFWSHYQGWWDARNLPNVMLVHYNNLNTDLGGEMRRSPLPRDPNRGRALAHARRALYFRLHEDKDPRSDLGHGV
jgi:aryl sulfotransferase